MNNKYSKIFFLVFIGTLTSFSLAFVGFLYPWVNTIVFSLIVGVTLYLVFKKPEIGIFLLFIELVIGSKGYLFSQPILDQLVSIRLALFLVVLFWFIINVIKTRKISFLKTSYVSWFGAFLVMVAFGAINGWIKNPHDIWFYDINAYFFLAMILPLFQAIKNTDQLKKLLTWILAGIAGIIIVTLLVSATFGSIFFEPGILKATRIDAEQFAQLDKLATAPDDARVGQSTGLEIYQLQVNWNEISPERPAMYRWLRDSGTAEIAYLGGRVFRSFMASHIYLLSVLFLVLVYLSFYLKKQLSKKIFIASISLIIITAAIVISYSRSIWFGVSVGFLSLLFLIPRKNVLRLLLLTLGIIIILGGAIYILSPSTVNVITERFESFFQPSNEIAASNRLQLLPAVFEKLEEKPALGSGFGTLVTYRAVLAGTDIVEFVKVYLYEWAYLDIAVKIGIIGLGLYLSFIYSILRLALRIRNKVTGINQLIILTLIPTVIALLAANVLTPYLNHPLGIGLLFVAAISFHIIHREVNLE